MAPFCWYARTYFQFIAISDCGMEASSGAGAGARGGNGIHPDEESERSISADFNG